MPKLRRLRPKRGILLLNKNMNRNITASILIILAIAIYFTFTRGMWDAAMTAKVVNSDYISAIAKAKTLVELRDQVNAALEQKRKDKVTPYVCHPFRVCMVVRCVFGFDDPRMLGPNRRTDARAAPLLADVGPCRRQAIDHQRQPPRGDTR